MKIKKYRKSNLNSKEKLKIIKRGILIYMISLSLFSLSSCSKNKNNLYKIEEKQEFNDEKVRIIKTDFSSNDINSLSSDCKYLEIIDNRYIDDLSLLPTITPNLETLIITNAPSLTNLDFIYNLHSLKKLIITSSSSIDLDLIKYLNENNIETNLNEKDIVNSYMIDKIIDENIKENMSNEEKIKKIVLYVAKNYKYDIKKLNESNTRPLDTMLETNKGVCASYAYLTTLLLNRVGIKAYELDGNFHSWVLVENNSKYYYIDITNIKDGTFIHSIKLIKYLNTGIGYMVDPNTVFMTDMLSYDDENLVIPKELIEDIASGEELKNIYERYGTSYSARVLEIIIISVLLLTGTSITLINLYLKDENKFIEERKKEAYECNKLEK